MWSWKSFFSITIPIYFVIVVIFSQLIINFSTFSLLFRYCYFTLRLHFLGFFSHLLLIPMDKKYLCFLFKCRIWFSHCTAYDWKAQISKFKTTHLKEKADLRHCERHKLNNSRRCCDLLFLFCSLMSVF